MPAINTGSNFVVTKGLGGSTIETSYPAGSIQTQFYTEASGSTLVFEFQGAEVFRIATAPGFAGFGETYNGLAIPAAVSSARSTLGQGGGWG